MTNQTSVMPVKQQVFEADWADIEKLGEYARLEINRQLQCAMGTGESLRWAVFFFGGQIKVAKSAEEVKENNISLCIHPDGYFEITLMPFTPLYRDNFKIAHELGHLILHYPYSSNPFESSLYPRYSSEPYEAQADYFAACFLMPRKEFIEVKARYNNDKEKIAAYFETVELSVDIRSQYLHV